MVVLTRFALPTNTPVFQEYAYGAMFTNAQAVAVKWHLDQGLIATNNVTAFIAKAYPAGFSGTMIFGGRYRFGFHKSQMSHYSDLTYDPHNFNTDNVQTNDALLEKWMRMTNTLTLKKAQEIAEAAIQSLGIPMRKLGFKKPTRKGQYTYEWKDGVVYPVPAYKFVWENDDNFCDVRVSGIISNIAYFSFAGTYLKFQRPTNYFEMLGLPKNPVFVRRLPRLPVSPPRPPEYELYEPDPGGGL
jgi:hypothetical protein